MHLKALEIAGSSPKADCDPIGMLQELHHFRMLFAHQLRVLCADTFGFGQRAIRTSDEVQQFSVEQREIGVRNLDCFRRVRLVRDPTDFFRIGMVRFSNARNELFVALRVTLGCGEANRAGEKALRPASPHAAARRREGSARRSR
jgi:hypothetical protein